MTKASARCTSGSCWGQTRRAGETRARTPHRRQPGAGNLEPAAGESGKWLLQDLVHPLLRVGEDRGDGLGRRDHRLERVDDGALDLDDVLHRQLRVRVLELVAGGERLGI